MNCFIQYADPSLCTSPRARHSGAFACLRPSLANATLTGTLHHEITVAACCLQCARQAKPSGRMHSHGYSHLPHDAMCAVLQAAQLRRLWYTATSSQGDTCGWHLYLGVRKGKAKPGRAGARRTLAPAHVATPTWHSLQRTERCRCTLPCGQPEAHTRPAAALVQEALRQCPGYPTPRLSTPRVRCYTSSLLRYTQAEGSRIRSALHRGGNAATHGSCIGERSPSAAANCQGAQARGPEKVPGAAGYPLGSRLRGVLDGPHRRYSHSIGRCFVSNNTYSRRDHYTVAAHGNEGSKMY